MQPYLYKHKCIRKVKMKKSRLTHIYGKYGDVTPINFLLPFRIVSSLICFLYGFFIIATMSFTSYI